MTQIIGTALVNEVITETRAGVAVTAGVLRRGGYVRVVRDGVVVHGPAPLHRTKRFKNEVNEVRAGQEAGIKIIGYEEQVGDVIEMLAGIEVKAA